MKTPVTIYVVHHPQCSQAETLANRLFDWFRLGYLSGDSSEAGLPVHFRRELSGTKLHPPIPFDKASLNVVILLVDSKMVFNEDWRRAVVDLATDINSRRGKKGRASRILLPGAMHDSFYRTGPLYEFANPIRLIGMTEELTEATLRRAATEAIARIMLSRDSTPARPLDVFLSHAKRDGAKIAESIRDSVRKFSQLRAWYDANDLPFGADWKSPMVRAAQNGTAAMIATVTDAYPTRPWCRREAQLARTPRRATNSKTCKVWKVQPVVAVHQPGAGWVRGVPMLDGVPRIGWDQLHESELTERVVDRLVLEVLLGNVHRQLALKLESRLEGAESQESCFVTWVPDHWTLVSLRNQLGQDAASIRRIIYPGYGLSVAEIVELEAAVATFRPDTRLVSYEEMWS